MASLSGMGLGELWRAIRSLDQKLQGKNRVVYWTIMIVFVPGGQLKASVEGLYHISKFAKRKIKTSKKK